MSWFLTQQVLAGLGGGNFLSGLVAYWDFSESAAPFVSKLGTAGPVELVNGAGSAVTKVADGPTGNAVAFNGSSDYLVCPAASNGLLNIGKNGGNQVTVLAFYKAGTGGSTNDFIAGLWEENDADPRRQYGLFYSLPMYGGEYKACLHISKTGLPTPGYSYSIDYSANGYTDSGNLKWTCLSGTYNGLEMRSYIEGRFEPYPNYMGYSKNPYIFPDGLNSADGEFTVGAVKLTSGYGNFLNGRLANIMVFNRALSNTEIAQCQRWIDSGNLYGFVNSAFVGAAGTKPVSVIGSNAYISPTCIDRTNDTASGAWSVAFNSGYSYVQSGSTSPSGIRALTLPVIPTGLTTDNIDSISFESANTSLTPKFRIMVNVAGNWYASESEYGVDVVSTGPTDWTNAKVGTLSFTKSASNWRDVVINPGVALTLAGSVRTQDIPSGTVQAYGIIREGSSPGDMRFRNFTIKVKSSYIN